MTPRPEHSHYSRPDHAERDSCQIRSNPANRDRGACGPRHDGLRHLGSGILSLVLGACGGEAGHAGPGPSAGEIASCFKRSGASAEVLESEAGIEQIGAQALDGDVIFVVTLQHPEVSAKAAEALKKGLRESGNGGIMAMDSVKHGSVILGVIGVKGVDGGVAAPESKMLAKRCAVEPRAKPHAIA